MSEIIQADSTKVVLNLDRIQDPEVKAAFMVLLRVIEDLKTTHAKAINLARTWDEL